MTISFETKEEEIQFKRLIHFAVRNVLKYNMLNQKMGTWNDFLGTFEFSEDEWSKLNEQIKLLDFPSGYYDLCDLVGDNYELQD